jgi:hypothetical protein
MTSTPEPRRIVARPLGVAPTVGHAARVRRFSDALPAYRAPNGQADAVAAPARGIPKEGGVPGKRKEWPGQALVRPSTAPAEADLRAEHRHIASIARLVGQAAFETMAGLRPVHQLARWLDPESFDKMCDRVLLTKSAHHAAEPRLYRNTAVRRTRLCRVADGVYEASLVVVDQTRVHAAALRIERRRGQWKVSALEIG